MSHMSSSACFLPLSPLRPSFAATRTQSSPARRQRVAQCCASNELPRRAVLRTLGLAPLVLLGVDARGVPTGFVALEDAAATRPRGDVSTLLRDVVYPPMMKGRWRVRSELVGVDAPAGDGLFAGLDAARGGIGTAVEYDVRFLLVAGDVVADRAFNVERVAAASLGERAVLEVRVGGINRVGVVVRPEKADGRVFDVRLEIGTRRTASEEGVFYAREGARQVVKETESGREQIKDVETITRYDYSADRLDTVKGVQRTMVYLPKGDPRAKDTEGKPIDVRTYELTYTRLR